MRRMPISHLLLASRTREQTCSLLWRWWWRGVQVSTGIRQSIARYSCLTNGGIRSPMAERGRGRCECGPPDSVSLRSTGTSNSTRRGKGCGT
uniref:Uncharacterized protein n=1 Tax=Zea mays TaxID=4577 RepID=C0HJ96_MAIZE|nr:unknown [Zea mays]